MNNNKNKNKPVIEDVKIDPKKLTELNEILNSGCSQCSKKQAMKQIAGGCCCICGSIPDKIVKYKIEDATVAERYCDKCFERWIEGKDNDNKDKVLLTATNGIDEIIAVRGDKK